MAPTVPHPRPALPGDDDAHRTRWARWYEDELGWATVRAPGEPVLLRTGTHFDVLELPAEAGHAVLRRIGPTGPVALLGRRMRLLLAAGSAEEVPSLLDWLEWGSVALDLRATGTGGLIAAPAPPDSGPLPSGGAAVWLRPPVPGHEGKRALPAFAGIGGSGDAPDLVRLLAAAATECHRTRLTNANAKDLNGTTELPKMRQAQPLAFS
ncbi:SCO3374 family protein [Streptomyces sp. NBC_00237]|uniref:SCO3374 family protein n=1 Tax=Streptomyces sp. NBC_00237 TaxID=2975687 RepID=UPI00225B6F37|nr:SCO3374 family protein [Streptomyces sp. NBC_00237]MCX5207426.1 SCO3374 family protein [Streptomyces sp. NBC_00237]